VVSAGGRSGESSSMAGFVPQIHTPLVCTYGLPVPPSACTAAPATARSKRAFSASPVAARCTTASACAKRSAVHAASNRSPLAASAPALRTRSAASAPRTSAVTACPPATKRPSAAEPR
jgi:hypothetical protein